MSPHFLHETLATFADHARQPALRFAEREMTFGELDKRVSQGAACLQGLGMNAGERVVLLVENKLSFLMAHLSVLVGGGVSLPLNPRFTAEELRFFLVDSEPRLIVVGAEQRERVGRLLADFPHTQAVDAQTILDAPPAAPRRLDFQADDPCLMLYSSGTTGRPKGVVHTHANLAASLRALQECWRVTADDVIVNVLPLFHIHGLSFATHLSLLSGSCMIVEDNFHPVNTLEVIGRGTIFMAVPTIYYRFLEQAEFAAAAKKWTGVRLFTCGSAPIRPEVLPGLEGILGRPVINRYGMTEAHVITSLPLDGPWPQGSVGLPLRGVELQLVNDDGQAVGVGAPGRVHVRGPNLFRAYWRQPEAAHKAWARGWFDTGDLGTLDEHGFLTLVGRSNDLIITNGYNVYPQVVERTINACPGVRESAVFGLPDTRRGERVAAAVVRSEASLTEDAIQAYLSERLIDYQRPRDIVFVDELPRNAMGKVLRHELKSWFGDGAGSAKPG